MKICILTQPLSNNYGGILQAYALQRVLREQGHDAWTLDRSLPAYPFLRKCRTSIRRAIDYNILGRKAVGRRAWMWPTPGQEAILHQHTRRFVQQRMQLFSLPPKKSDPFSCILEHGFDAYVVGSDQVWRPCFSPELFAFFLDFTGNAKVRRVSYAASFGTDQWEFDQLITERCTQLARNFDCISVREDSGVELCSNYLGVEAVQMPDPALLLSRKAYEDLADEMPHQIPESPFLCSYILDPHREKEEFISRLAKSQNLRTYSPMPKRHFFDARNSQIQDSVYPGVEAWLSAIRHSQLVVTDSFHGCLLSLIFGKPFYLFRPTYRGAARIDSLLRLFSLLDERNCIIAPSYVDFLECDLTHVTARLDRLSLQGSEYLATHLPA